MKDKKEEARLRSVLAMLKFLFKLRVTGVDLNLIAAGAAFDLAINNRI